MKEKRLYLTKKYYEEKYKYNKYTYKNNIYDVVFIDDYFNFSLLMKKYFICWNKGNNENNNHKIEFIYFLKTKSTRNKIINKYNLTIPNNLTSKQIIKLITKYMIENKLYYRQKGMNIEKPIGIYIKKELLDISIDKINDDITSWKEKTGIIDKENINIKNNDLKKENEELKKENNDLKKENEELKKENNDLKKENEELKKII